MLTRTFCHLPGIGLQTEQRLWDQGCLSWEMLQSDPGGYRIPKARRPELLDGVARSFDALSRGDAAYFAEALPADLHWRVWPELRGKTVYLDIETDGGRTGSAITTVGLYDGREFRCLIRDRDLNQLPDVLGQYGVVVSFFGAGFDLPLIRRRFPGIAEPPIHLDLCFLLRGLGIRGGLKKIEQQLGIGRGSAGLSGLDAIYLWRRFRKYGDQAALDKLVAYNRDDVVNLEQLMEFTYSKLLPASFRVLPTS